MSVNKKTPLYIENIKKRKLDRCIEAEDTRIELNKLMENVSQYSNKQYEALKADGCASKFLQLVAHCALNNLSIESTVQLLNDKFFDYFEDNGLTVSTFKKMLVRYVEIAEAWACIANTSGASACLIRDGLMKRFFDNKLSFNDSMKLMEYLDDGSVNKKSSADYVSTKRVISNITTTTETIDNKANNSDSTETKATLETINEMLKTYKD